MTPGWFITGTDTGVGKTLVSQALLRSLAKQYQQVVGMKPIAAGAEPIDGVMANDDVLALRTASTLAVSHRLDNPVLLPDPLSPHIAARRVGVEIDIDHIVACYQGLASLADAIVVEGAGGFHVPLSDDLTGADLAVALDLPMVLVVGLRLGCLNHALLTADAIRARGLRLVGWVANRLDPSMLATQDNIDWIQHRLGVPMLADVPYQPTPGAQSFAMAIPAV